MDIEEIIVGADQKAEEIIANHEPIRDELNRGRPNSSDTSSADGALRALDRLLKIDEQLSDSAATA
ncbi:MAG: hypothetical protein ACI8UO_003785 [Verrucomicrobiales bacterium]|jgi:hypothetical protein